MMHKKSCIFEPVDSCFFRESRPSDALGNSELTSVFPPPVRTLLGAVRTAIGDIWHSKNGTNWREFDELTKLHELIGYGDELGPLSVNGPFILKNKVRYYPAPANLMIKQRIDEQNLFFTLRLGESPVRCDVGQVKLATFPVGNKEYDYAGAKPAEGFWINDDGFKALLNGQVPNEEDLIELKKIIHGDPRLGIARDNKRAGIVEGLLYQTRHLRLDEDVSIEIVVSGLPDSSVLNLPESQLVRLGGEGRFTNLAIDNPTDLPLSGIAQGENRIMIYFITPMLVSPNLPAGIPIGFLPCKHDGCDVWEGHINDVKLRIWSVVCGKTLREGGWNLAKHQPTAVESYLPAGTVLYAEVIDGSESEFINSKLHGQVVYDDQLQKKSPFNRGKMLIGSWFKD